jgi:hypothetical protein
LLPGGDPRPNQRNLIVHIFNRVLKFEAQTSGLTDLTAHHSLRHHEVRLRGIDRCLFDRHLHAKWLRVELNQHIAFLYAIIVIDQYSQDLTWYPRRYERYIAIHVSVIGRDGMPGAKNPRDDNENNDQAT